MDAEFGVVLGRTHLHYQVGRGPELARVFDHRRPCLTILAVDTVDTMAGMRFDDDLKSELFKFKNGLRRRGNAFFAGMDLLRDADCGHN